MAAAERGKEVIVSLNEVFVVADHDFTLTPSVIQHVALPEQFEGSWYSGKVLVGLKDSVFETSSPIRHAAELYSILLTRLEGKSILCVYSDVDLITALHTYQCICL